MESHPGKWRPEDGDRKVFAKLMEEVDEVRAAYSNMHGDPVYLELLQVAAISLNWVRFMVEYGAIDIRDLEHVANASLRKHGV